MEPHLRKLGLPTRLHGGVVEVLQETVVCRAGDVLTPEQCKLLQLFGVKMATFKVQLIAAWQAETGEVEELREGALEAGKGKKAAVEEGVAEEEGEEEAEDSEFIADPMEGWGEVAVPSYT